MNIILKCIRQRLFPQSFPDTAEELAKSDLFTGWWYYSVELLPGLITKGHYPDSFPLLPRILLRNCDLRRDHLPRPRFDGRIDACCDVSAGCEGSAGDRRH
jgi:hypothetical protein